MSRLLRVLLSFLFFFVAVDGGSKLFYHCKSSSFLQPLSSTMVQAQAAAAAAAGRNNAPRRRNDAFAGATSRVLRDSAATRSNETTVPYEKYKDEFKGILSSKKSEGHWRENKGFSEGLDCNNP